MVSVSMSSALPAHPPYDPVPDLSVSTKPIHTRRTSRNPKLAPLPDFSFNPGVIAGISGDQQQSSPGAGLSSEEADNEAQRKCPLPLPAFSFNPGATLQLGNGAPSPTHPILEEMAQNTSRHPSKAAPSLPAFSFNPSVEDAQRTPSPTKSSFSQDPPGSARSIGHRRGASEFIGVGDAAQQPVLPPFSTSPQKAAMGPPVSGHGPPRFTHQHRRSQAVSISEIETSELIKANAVAKHRAGSMPSSPTDLPSNDHFSRASQSISSLYGRTPPTSPRRRGSAAGCRPRVGFSETVDVIPRPLSMISSETEGSSSTVRGNHSLTGSITSLGSPAARSSPSPSLDAGGPATRPKTADAASPSQQLSMRSDESLSTCDLPKRPLSASDSISLFSSSGSPASRKRFWFTSGGSNEVSPRTTPKQTPVEEENDPITSFLSFAPATQTADAQPRTKTSPNRKVNIKQRKVRTLAGAIFSRKARSRAAPSRGRRTPTPPLSRPFTGEMADSVFDEDNTVVIRDTASPEQDRQQAVVLDHGIQTDAVGPDHDDDDDDDDHVTSPIIDLDAALGPFGSEDMLPQSGFAAARSRMHSSTGRGVADAFGVVHRRAESAPQMSPINRNVFGMHRMGSNGNVAEDVFDEEEEDDFLAEESKPKAVSAPETVESSTFQVPGGSYSSRTSGATEDRVAASSQLSIGLAISTNVSDGIEIVDDEEDLAREAARSSDSTLTAPVMPETETKGPTVTPMAFAYPAPQASYASSGEGRSAPNSAISSPDVDHVNFDHYARLSRHMGEPNPDPGLRFSTEDVPSLCDSVSTGNAPRGSGGAVTRSSADHRASSVSSQSIRRPSKTPQAWKRASLASLNRLIPGSSHGERSRLRFEETAQHEQEEKTRKKGNRISRLMNFWRSKELVNK